MVTVGKDESLEHALKRFKRKCKQDGIQQDLKKFNYYLKPSEKRKLSKRLSLSQQKKNDNI